MNPFSPLFHMPQGAQYPSRTFQQPMPFNPAPLSAAHRPQYAPHPAFAPHPQFPPHPQFAPQYAVGPARRHVAQSPYHQYFHMDTYGFGIGAPHYPSHDYSSGRQAFQAGPQPGAQFARRASEPGPVSLSPRGPPLNPKQLCNALWVGNLPSAATVIDLKDHFSRDARKDIESLYLISNSNCAFVNYRSEAACIAARKRFHNSHFRGVTLICRFRRGLRNDTINPTVIDHAGQRTNSLDTAATTIPPSMETSSQVIVGSQSPTAIVRTPTKVPERFFIVKSFTKQDLEASIRNGTWATQSHNETVLNRAFEETERVYLIFSANKSGEFFGYARMISPISGEPVNLSAMAENAGKGLPGTLRSMRTPATQTAPKGCIIEDLARGTIFWEADTPDKDGNGSSQKKSGDGSPYQKWGRQFKIEWISNSRLPFDRTRGLRNPWNADRPVKVARDGTELEPHVGKKLVQMFHRSHGRRPQAGLPHR